MYQFSDRENQYKIETLAMYNENLIDRYKKLIAKRFINYGEDIQTIKDGIFIIKDEEDKLLKSMSQNPKLIYELFILCTKFVNNDPVIPIKVVCREDFNMFYRILRKLFIFYPDIFSLTAKIPLIDEVDYDMDDEEMETDELDTSAEEEEIEAEHFLIDAEINDIFLSLLDLNISNAKGDPRLLSVLMKAKYKLLFYNPLLEDEVLKNEEEKRINFSALSKLRETRKVVLNGRAYYPNSIDDDLNIAEDSIMNSIIASLMHDDVFRKKDRNIKVFIIYIFAILQKLSKTNKDDVGFDFLVEMIRRSNNNELRMALSKTCMAMYPDVVNEIKELNKNQLKRKLLNKRETVTENN